MTDNDNRPDPIAMLDQIGTALENVAATLGNYHGALIRAGIPKRLPHDLVRDYYARMLYESGKEHNA